MNRPAILSLARSKVKLQIYVGTYTSGCGAGVYTARFCPEMEGRSDEMVLAAEIENGSFLSRHPRLDVLYGVSEVTNLQGAGAIFAWAVEPLTGKLRLWSRRSSLEAGPCHVAVNLSGEILAAANY